MSQISNFFYFQFHHLFFTNQVLPSSAKAELSCILYFSHFSWVMLFMWPQNLSSALLPVSPQYWGWSGHTLLLILQVPIYRMFLLVKISLPQMKVLLLSHFLWCISLSRWSHCPIVNHSNNQIQLEIQAIYMPTKHL